MQEVCKLEDPQCAAILLEELRNLFIGQSYDLYWTRQGECPSEDEYREMISQSKPVLFQLDALSRNTNHSMRRDWRFVQATRSINVTMRHIDTQEVSSSNVANVQTSDNTVQDYS